MTEVVKKRCIHRHLENGIHEFVFTESSRAAVDEWMSLLEQIYEQYADQTPELVRMSLIDVRQSGTLPLNYFFKSWQDWNRKHPAPTDTKGRVAGLHNVNEFVVGLVQSFANLFSPDTKVSFFKGDKREDAIAWLLKEKATLSQQ
jgi:hypothetical protein